MITQIGIIAGEIWRILEEQEEVRLSKLSEKVERKPDLILMSLGWLAREGHILVEGEEDYTISLRNKQNSLD